MIEINTPNSFPEFSGVNSLSNVSYQHYVLGLAIDDLEMTELR